jgi:outer membrane receptor protein involved in Fe transport
VLGYEDGGEVETVEANYGSGGWTGDIFFHDMFGTYDMSNGFSFFAGIDNVTDKKPFVSERAYPVSPVGRYFWAGFNYAMGN